MIEFAPQVILTETEHGVVLLDGDTGGYWITNGNGAVVVRSLARDGTAADAATALRAANPSLDGDIAARDVAALLDELRRSGLVLP
ncbi:lasso peptide biosynthesis PqqD family chaperone [Saccharopolyspora sp. CA-218241]|uniref:lasso peptide biosynthesis PqqD family chaperone n=1 Tax=Saccharopolyspora sp. CA-218241 TaxID=3240027 RepID=UPI003D98A090